nr:DUF6529 family protein [Nocardia albiluteola]
MHSIAGTAFYGAFAAKMLALRLRGTPFWLVPVLAGSYSDPLPRSGFRTPRAELAEPDLIWRKRCGPPRPRPCAVRPRS